MEKLLLVYYYDKYDEVMEFERTAKSVYGIIRQNYRTEHYIVNHLDSLKYKIMLRLYDKQTRLH